MIRYRAETKDVAAYGALAEWHQHARALHRPSRELLGHLVGERLQRRPGAAVNDHLGVQAHGTSGPAGGRHPEAQGPGRGVPRRRAMKPRRRPWPWSASGAAWGTAPAAIPSPTRSAGAGAERA